MGFDAKQLLDLIPLAVGALKPGSPEAAAFMRGYQRSQQQLHQQGLQDRQFQRQDELTQAQIGNLTADNQRADQQMQNQTAQLALNRLTSYRHENQQFMNAINTAPESVVQPQTDPLQAQNALTVERLQAQQQYGVPPGTPQGPLPDMTQAVTKSKAKLAQTLYQQAEKEFGAAAMAADSITIQTGPDKFGDVKPSALRGMFAPQATTASGAPATPLVKPDAGRNLQSKEMLQNGKRIVVNFEPDTGKYFDLQGNPLTDIAPIPPASAGGGQPGQLPIQTQRRVDQKSKGFDSQAVVKNTQKMAEAVSFANSLDPNTTNPADDQALIYAFAKAMDPDSVVREGEYATVQKYAQSWAQTFGFNAARVFTNTSFLTAQARQNMKTTIQKKFAAGKSQYDNVRKSYADQIDKITGEPGSGEQWLVDYGGAFPSTGPATDSQLPPGVTVKRRP